MPRDPVHSRLSMAHHRIVARVVHSEPRVVDEARQVVASWIAADRSPPSFVSAWRRLVSAPKERLVEQIIRRTPEAERLRESSPFALIPSRLLTPRQVERLWRTSITHAIRILDHSEYAAYGKHLKALDAKDRVRRFFCPVNDRWIDNFVATLRDDANVAVIGHFNDNLELDGAVQIGFLERDGVRLAEIGLTVLAEARHHGLGNHLMERALLWARNHGATRFYAVFAVDNMNMIRLARIYHMEVSYGEGGIEGVVRLFPQTAASISEEVLENQIGEWDYHTKAHDAAFSFVLRQTPHGTDQWNDLERLVKLARFGGPEIISSYLIVFRYALILSGVSAEDHRALLAGLKARLAPLVADDPELRTYIRGLPVHPHLSTPRTDLWRSAAAHRETRAVWSCW
ncbi:MAG: GNAT family N-acetyltransferase [Hyphomicrobiales bacterium]|nr:GNAT family N-acetyltransferase [Hyphomicrobiales bacterium]